MFNNVQIGSVHSLASATSSGVVSTLSAAVLTSSPTLALMSASSMNTGRTGAEPAVTDHWRFRGRLLIWKMQSTLLCFNANLWSLLVYLKKGCILLAAQLAIPKENWKYYCYTKKYEFLKIPLKFVFLQWRIKFLFTNQKRIVKQLFSV